ncbi:MAG: zinc metallopeptidase [Clostridia bacterium]|nr:zinc metallopeptidase [Clostridia bacterium]
MLYWEYYLMGIILLPGIIFAIWAQARVNTTYSKYSKVISANGYTGKDAVLKMLNENGINDVSVMRIDGELTDNFNPRTKRVSLSNNVYSSSTIAALGVAAHECGHAIQHSRGYAPAKLRSVVVTVSNISSTILWPIVFLGLFLGFAVDSPIGKMVLWSGIIVFGLSFLFSLITLPVELDASKRAINELVRLDIVDNTEVIGAREVLNAAALTYVAAMVVSLLNLLRFLLVFLRRND